MEARANTPNVAARETQTPVPSSSPPAERLLCQSRRWQRPFKGKADQVHIGRPHAAEGACGLFLLRPLAARKKDRRSRQLSFGGLPCPSRRSEARVSISPLRRRQAGGQLGSKAAAAAAGHFPTVQSSTLIRCSPALLPYFGQTLSVLPPLLLKWTNP
eukprot:TRINITY_DN4396_c0_g2_i1.p1 TRINITY_DN4396_c0_g2~~TRINITY_DN4396_c0_g2_i1.p1  ORF type:complete len:158 (-),score=24.33 TRINITY_DN4396_c0_g2_i1:636-1109(-)